MHPVSFSSVCRSGLFSNLYIVAIAICERTTASKRFSALFWCSFGARINSDVASCNSGKLADLRGRLGANPGHFPDPGLRELDDDRVVAFERPRDVGFVVVNAMSRTSGGYGTVVGNIAYCAVKTINGLQYPLGRCHLAHRRTLASSWAQILLEPVKLGDPERYDESLIADYVRLCVILLCSVNICDDAAGTLVSLRLPRPLASIDVVRDDPI
ncbi:hypothetical protein DFH06DRAFT_1306716 [Mycena polygramma]|nr:hypothetical protein DFH06DRAFT_1306716 [Mycena polygramma]